MNSILALNLNDKDNILFFIIVISVSFLLLVIGLSLIYFFVIRRSRQRKVAKELEKRYRRLHTLLVEDIEQFIARLEYISNQNLEYIRCLSAISLRSR